MPKEEHKLFSFYAQNVGKMKLVVTELLPKNVKRVGKVTFKLVYFKGKYILHSRPTKSFIKK